MLTKNPIDVSCNYRSKGIKFLKKRYYHNVNILSVYIYFCTIHRNMNR